MDMIKEMRLMNFMMALKKDLMLSLQETPKLTTEQINWLLRDVTAKHVWYPMIEKSSPKYKDYLEKIKKNG